MTAETKTESSRLDALLQLLVLDSSEETAFNDITRMAADVCQTPVALISLIDENRQWFKARIGTNLEETPREYAFCAHAIKRPSEVMVVPDATQDPRFNENPLVVESPKIRFYAGAPLVTTSGHAVGTLCVIDVVPREVDEASIAQLKFMAGQVATMLEIRAARLKKK